MRENVLLDKKEEIRDEDVIEALKQSGFEERFENLENGLSTMMTKEFSKKGVNLSGGEAQKVAIARVFLGNSRMVILDEPSSALDPLTEYEINNNMLAAAKDKSIVYISHRLSTTRMADKIFMLENGSIIEHGSHDELMNMDGKYAEMFNLQAEKYKENVG